jgi:signal transduction histidine kinase
VRHGLLHRRLFAWFGASILLTGLVVAATFSAIARLTESSWDRDFERVQRFAGDAFAREWSDPTRREDYARMVARDLEVEVVLFDGEAEVGRFGPDCHGRGRWRVPVERDGQPLGAVELCAPRQSAGPLKLLIPLFVLLVILWAASGKIARRLAHPLTEVARVAKEIGDGNLAARPRVDRRDPMEVRMLADAIDDMAKRIERQLEDQRVLLAAVSHELRTPLGHLRLLAELGRNGDPQQFGKVLDQIEAEVKEIDELVGQLLASARLDFTSIDPRPFDAAEAAARALERKGLDPSWLAVEAGDTAARGDPTLIARALANLIDNAERHGKGLTKLRIRRDGARVVFEAEDDGPGIDEADRLFELFQTKTREHGNLGLGLALVRRIAEAHGGRAFAANRDGGGARIGFEI